MSYKFSTNFVTSQNMNFGRQDSKWHSTCPRVCFPIDTILPKKLGVAIECAKFGECQPRGVREVDYTKKVP
jgi:hypothetical protein